MALRKRTILFFAAVFLLAFAVVELVSIYWAMVGVTLIFLFVGSMFMFLWFDYDAKKKPRIDAWPSVSCIIPNYNGSGTVIKCVEAVKAMSYPKKFEVLVVDDGSTDNSVSLLKKIKGIKLLAKKKNAGKGAAINSALKTAKGDLVACIDSDTYPEKNCLMEMVPHFSNPKVGAVTGLITVHEPKNLFQRVQEIEYYLGFGFYQTMLALINAAFVTPGPMAVYRRKLILGLGGYDEGNITEDMEIALRVQKSGHYVQAAPEAHIPTVVPETWRPWVRQRIRWYRGKIYNTALYKDLLFNPKYGGLGLFSLPFTFLLELAAIFIFFLIGVLIIKDATFALQVILSWANISAPIVVELPPLIVNSSAVFFWVTTLTVFGFSSVMGLRIGKKKIGLKTLVPMIVIVLGYGYAVACMWLISFFKEVNGSSYDW